MSAGVPIVKALPAVLLSLLLIACADSEAPRNGSSSSSAADTQSAPIAERQVTITLQVPEHTGTVYLTGNLDIFGPWEPDGMAMQGQGTERVAVFSAPDGMLLEYKFTLGSWEREALGESGDVEGNLRLRIDGDTQAHHQVEKFRRARFVQVRCQEARGAGVWS